MFEGFYNNYGLNYAQAFAYEFGLTTLVYGFSALALSYVLYGIAYLIKRTIKNRYTSVKPKESEEEIYIDSFKELHENLNTVSVSKSKDPKRIAVKIITVLSHLVSWYALLAIAIAPSCLSGLGVIPVWSSVIITFIIFLIKYVGLVYTLSPSFLNKNKDQANRSFCSSFWRRIAVTSTMYKFTLGLFLACSILYSVLVPLATENTCMNFYNEGYGVMYQDFGLSTKFSRHFQLDTVCKKGKICHVYSTIPEDGSSSIIINVHTGVDVTSIQVGYKETDDNVDETLVSPQSFYIDMNEDRGNRYLHSAYLHGLTNNTNYTFSIYFDNKKQRSGQFRTLPSQSLERNFTMAAGGDVGTTEDAKDMTNILSNYDLDTILIGGDLGYDNGMKSCYYSLDMFLNFFEGLNAQANRLIPIMVSVGNHDVGFNAFQGTQIDISENLYFAFFPQHSATDSEGTLLYQVPALSDRLSYAYHVIGNTLHLALDSQYITPYDAQVDFINKTSTQYSHLVKFANFHVPMYPTCFDADYDDPRTLSVPRQIWAPLFEQHKFMSVFENHVHLYKKSFPLVNGTIQEGGVVYFGDGNWGISPNSCEDYPGGLNGNNTGLLEAYEDTRHVWLINITNINITHYAVNETNGIFDQPYPFPVNNYTINMDL